MRLLPLAFVAMSAAFSPSARATVVVLPDLPELAQKTDVIVEAQVVGQTMVAEGGRIWTRTTLTVLDGLKGAKVGDTLVVHQLGGRVGDRQMWVTGARRFAAGERFVLFGMRWSKQGADAIIPFGVGFGVFDIVEEPTGALVVKEQIGDVVAYKVDATGQRTAVKPAPRTWISVDAFKDELRGLLTAQQRGVGIKPAQVLQQPARTVGGAR